MAVDTSMTSLLNVSLYLVKKVNDTFYFSGFIKKNSNVFSTIIRISQPYLSEAGDDWFCELEISEYFSGRRKIYGVDAAQSVELTFDLLKNLLEGSTLIDEQGKNVKLCELDSRLN
jgi:hypothetical protein